MPIVTLLSDFGLKDASVGIAKGILYQVCPGILLTDISHEAKPFQIEEAAYLLGVTYRNFPPGSINFILSDLYGGVSNRLILAREKDWFFLCPDNGVLPLALGKNPDFCWLYQELPQTATYSDCIRLAGNAIAALSKDPNGFTQNLKHWEPWRPAANAKASATDTEVDCKVLHIDHFENIVLNYTRKEFEDQRRGRIFEVRLKKTEVINRISNSYSDVREGDVLCRFNSAGHMEICVRNGRAAGLLGIRLGSTNNEIKIVFE